MQGLTLGDLDDGPIFDPPPPVEPPHSWYWQDDAKPYEVLVVPDGLTGPPGTHFISGANYADYLLRKKLGLELACYDASPNAPKPGQPFTPILPTRPERRPYLPAPSSPAPPPTHSPEGSSTRPVREPKPPRPPRRARKPRKPREPRPPRDSRPPRGPRPPRKARPPRKPRKPRKPRPPRRPGTKNQQGDCFCDALPGNQALGTAPPVIRCRPNDRTALAPRPGGTLIPLTIANPCTAATCSGPLKSVMDALLGVLPQGWRPQVDQRLIDKQNERREKANKRLPARPAPGTFKPVQKNQNPSGLCCPCGAVGFCGIQDCRLSNMLQRSLGQC